MFDEGTYLRGYNKVLLASSALFPMVRGPQSKGARRVPCDRLHMPDGIGRRLGDSRKFGNFTRSPLCFFLSLETNGQAMHEKMGKGPCLTFILERASGW
jgi:hypothetical protein